MERKVSDAMGYADPNQHIMTSNHSHHI